MFLYRRAAGPADDAAASGFGSDLYLRPDALLQGRHMRNHADELAVPVQPGQRIQRGVQRILIQRAKNKKFDFFKSCIKKEVWELFCKKFKSDVTAASYKSDLSEFCRFTEKCFQETDFSV